MFMIVCLFIKLRYREQGLIRCEVAMAEERGGRRLAELGAEIR